MVSASVRSTSRFPRVRDRLSPRERLTLGGMASFVAALHAAGWGGLIWILAAREGGVGADGAFGLGLGVAAYAMGLRHAFDADHIAAIDNTTRHLMHHGGRPLSVGFWFSLGHSTVVLVLCAAVAVGLQHLLGTSGGDSAGLQDGLSLAGAGVSATFLYVIGVSNLIILLGLVRVFRKTRGGAVNEAALESQLGKRGLVGRVVGPAGGFVRRPAQIYGVGLLFGLGLDTAAEVSLLVLAGGAAAVALPWYAVLALPVLFAAGMSLLDTLDGCFMNFAYGWALSKPVRKLYYNMVITAVSVAVALAIGSLQLAAVLGRGGDPGQSPGIWRLDPSAAGFTIAATFALAWLGAAAYWRWGRVDEKWQAAGLAAPRVEGSGAALEPGAKQGTNS